MFQYIEQTYANKDFSQADLKSGELKGCVFTRCLFRGTEMNEIWTTSCLVHRMRFWRGDAECFLAYEVGVYELLGLRERICLSRSGRTAK